MSELRIMMLGTFHITHGMDVIQIKRRKSIALMAYLAIMEQSQMRDKVATMLWPDYDQTRARAALRTTLSELKSTPLSKCLQITRDTVAIAPECKLWVDVLEFRNLLAKAYDENGDQTRSQNYADVEKAIELYRDGFLAGFSLSDSQGFDEWQSFHTESLYNHMVKALEYLVNGYVAQGQIDAGIHYALRWLSLDSLNERVHLQLMTLYAQSGQKVASLRQYEEYVRLLDEEMGMAPHSAITELYETIKTSESTLKDISVARRTGNTMPPLPTLAIGRDKDLSRIKSLAGIDTETTSNATVVIQGWPGVGKSTLVALLAHDRDINHAFADGVLWTSLGEEPNLLAKLELWGRALGIADIETSTSLENLMNQLSTHLSERNMLLIVDDVWAVEEAMPFKIGGSKCTIIFTTRFNDVANALAPTPEIIYKLGILSDQNGLDLLRTLAPTVVKDHYEEATQLVSDLEGLPLALQVAGRLLHAEAKMGWGVADLLEDLRDGARLLEAQAPADRIDIDTQITPTIAILLQKSVERLEPKLQEHFALLGVFAPKPATFDLDAMRAVWDCDDPRSSTRVLVDRGLLEPLGNGRFQMHALLAMHARSMFSE